MKSMIKLFALILMTALAIPPAWAVDVNFNLLNVNTPDQNRLQQTYANAYGFTPAQVSPVMMAPAPEVPTILQIAKSAAVMPLSIWAMRKLGLSYMDILKTYTLAPSTLFAPEVPYERFGPTFAPVIQAQKTYGPTWPLTINIADPLLIQLGQIRFFNVGLRIPGISILSLPNDPLSFTRLVLNPWGNPTYFIPPGQAMKMGLWTPPGLAKKGYVGHPGHGNWKGGGNPGKWEGNGKGGGKGKWEAKEMGGGGKGHGGGKGGRPF